MALFATGTDLSLGSQPCILKHQSSDEVRLKIAEQDEGEITLKQPGSHPPAQGLLPLL